jgi:hypothetical protein
MRLATILATALLASPALSESYDLSLGGNVIGTLDATDAGINSNVTNSPLGVGNGTFDATSRRVRLADGTVVTQYLSDAPRKNRTISVLHDAGRVIETVVNPVGDATALSVADTVPAGVTDPVAGLAHLLRDRATCPEPVSFYDGRRVITVSPTDQSTEQATLTCRMSYRVTAGPGHFSPLFISNAKMNLLYQGGALTTLTIGAGPFTLTVTPR